MSLIPSLYRGVRSIFPRSVQPKHGDRVAERNARGPRATPPVWDRRRVEAQLYVLTASHPCIAAELMLRRKGSSTGALSCRLVSRGILRAMRFPRKTVPAMRLDGRRVQDSRAISRVLEPLTASSGAAADTRSPSSSSASHQSQAHRDPDRSRDLGDQVEHAPRATFVGGQSPGAVNRAFGDDAPVPPVPGKRFRASRGRARVWTQPARNLAEWLRTRLAGARPTSGK